MVLEVSDQCHDHFLIYQLPNDICVPARLCELHTSLLKKLVLATVLKVSQQIEVPISRSAIKWMRMISTDDHTLVLSRPALMYEKLLDAFGRCLNLSCGQISIWQGAFSDKLRN